MQPSRFCSNASMSERCADDKELGSKLTYLTELGDLVGQQQDLLVQQSRYREADVAVAALAETRAKIQSEYRRSLF